MVTLGNGCATLGDGAVLGEGSRLVAIWAGDATTASLGDKTLRRLGLRNATIKLLGFLFAVCFNTEAFCSSSLAVGDNLLEGVNILKGFRATVACHVSVEGSSHVLGSGNDSIDQSNG